MLKKASLYCLICTVLLSLTVCKSSLNEELNTDTTNALLAFLIPGNAVIISHVDNLIILNSTQTVSELIIFYEDAFHKLELHEYEINDSQECIWIFSGVYNGIHNHIRGSGYDNEIDNRERPLIVELRTSSEGVEIEIVY